MNNGGDLLRQKRHEKGTTLETVANEVGVSINYISKLEKGENSNPSDEIIVRLAITLGIDEDTLFRYFEKTPLSIKRFLEVQPPLAEFVSKLSKEKRISTDEMGEFCKAMLFEYKKLISRK